MTPAVQGAYSQHVQLLAKRQLVVGDGTRTQQNPNQLGEAIQGVFHRLPPGATHACDMKVDPHSGRSREPFNGEEVVYVP